MQSGNSEERRNLEALMLLIELLSPPAPSLHKHRCGRCGVVWEHMTPPPEATEEDYLHAHMCPAGCGVEQRMKYHGEG